MALEAGITFHLQTWRYHWIQGTYPRNVQLKHMINIFGSLTEDMMIQSDFEVARNSYENFPNYDITFIKQQCDHKWKQVLSIE